MRKNMRAVAVALVVLTIGATSVLAQSRSNDPFAGADPFGPSQPKTSNTVEKLSEHHKAYHDNIHAVLKESPSSIKAHSQGIPTEPVTPADGRIRRALDEKTKLQFQDAEIGEVIAYLKRLHKIEIQLDRESLEEYDLGSDTLVTCTVKDISLRSALKLMLRDLDLTYIIRDEVLLITSEDVAQENRLTRIYDVADLVAYRDEKGIYTDYEPLIDVLTAAAEPESWMCMGGNGIVTGYDFGTARVVVVSQTEEVHSKIVGVLTAIRQVAAQHPGNGQPPWKPRPKPPQIKPMATGPAGGVPNPAGLPRGMGMGGGSGNMKSNTMGGMMNVGPDILPTINQTK